MEEAPAAIATHCDTFCAKIKMKTTWNLCCWWKMRALTRTIQKIALSLSIFVLVYILKLIWMNKNRLFVSFIFGLIVVCLFVSACAMCSFGRECEMFCVHEHLLCLLHSIGIDSSRSHSGEHFLFGRLPSCMLNIQNYSPQHNTQTFTRSHTFASLFHINFTKAVKHFGSEHVSISFLLQLIHSPLPCWCWCCCHHEYIPRAHGFVSTSHFGQ